MNYCNNSSIISLNKKFIKISQMGWIKGVGTGKGNIGITFENLIGKSVENFEWPDYEGIEIKTRDSLRNQYITLFSATPDGKDFFECKRLWEKYGYKSQSDSNINIFCPSVVNKKQIFFTKIYSASLEIDYKQEKIFLCIYNKNNLIDKNSFWSFKILEEKLYRKLKYLAIVDALSYKKNGNDFFKYTSIKFYKLKDFDTFLQLIENQYIKVNFSVSVFRNGYKKGKLHDHGTSFRILANIIPELYDKINISTS